MIHVAFSCTPGVVFRILYVWNELSGISNTGWSLTIAPDVGGACVSLCSHPMCACVVGIVISPVLAHLLLPV